MAWCYDCTECKNTDSSVVAAQRGRMWSRAAASMDRSVQGRRRAGGLPTRRAEELAFRKAHLPAHRPSVSAAACSDIGNSGAVGRSGSSAVLGEPAIRCDAVPCVNFNRSPLAPRLLSLVDRPPRFGGQVSRMWMGWKFSSSVDIE